MPFYGAPGILLNGTQVSAINLTGNGVIVAGGNAHVNGVNFVQGDTTVTNPQSINLAGTAALALGSVPPTIVQQAGTAMTGNFTIALPNPVTPGNLIVIIGGSERNFSAPAGLGFASACSYNDGVGIGVDAWHMVAGTSQNIFNCTGGAFGGTGSTAVSIYEISGYNNAVVGGAGSTAAPASDMIASPAIPAVQNDLILFCFAAVNYGGTYETPTPSGAVLDEQAGQGGQFTGTTGHYVAPGANPILGVTLSSDSGSHDYAYVVVPFSTSQINALITT